MLKHYESRIERINKKYINDAFLKSNIQDASFINEGNPNTQKLSADQQSAQMVKQAINDDQGLSKVARDIHVRVNDGTVTLDGEVLNDQQMNLATNTAAAIAVDEKVENHMQIKQ